MAKKLRNLEDKLGSWTDQAALTRNQAPTTTPGSSPGSSPAPARAAYPVERSLLDRIAAVGAAHQMNQNEVVGQLLTWALDQVESGAYELPVKHEG